MLKVLEIEAFLIISYQQLRLRLCVDCRSWGDGKVWTHLLLMADQCWLCVFPAFLGTRLITRGVVRNHLCGCVGATV